MRTADALEALLICAEDAVDPPVCRAFWNPGPEAPYDVCETMTVEGTVVNGQLWVGNTFTSEGWPISTSDPTSCRSNWTDLIEVGIVRCAQGVINDDGNAPDADLITADAQQQLQDRNSLREAILCCFDIEHVDLFVESWTPIPPEGGCVGGRWTIRVRDAGCDCGSES